MNARRHNAQGDQGQHGFGEKELAALNARADSSLLEDAAAWDDATLDASVECATFCESQARGWVGGTFDND